MRSALITLAGLSLFSCKPVGASTKPLPERFGWMVGRWVSDDGANVETWSVDGDGLRATNLTYRDEVVAFEERIELITVGGEVVYRAHPPSQSSHDFPLQSTDGTRATFADHEHDFPQTIEYRREGDRLTATLTGLEDGRPVQRVWVWRR